MLLKISFSSPFWDVIISVLDIEVMVVLNESYSSSNCVDITYIPIGFSVKDTKRLFELLFLRRQVVGWQGVGTCP
jgi:hypothetical protein